MAEEGGGEVVSFMAEQFRRLNARFDTFEQRMDRIEGRLDRLEGRLDRLEERTAQVERRLTALIQFEQSVVTHLAAINESQDSLKAQFLGVHRRLDALEAL